MSSIAKNMGGKILLCDDLSDTGITLNKSVDWLKKYEPIKDKIEGLGIKTLDVDGHNLNELISSFESIKKSKDLNCILARTIKGKGSSIMENKKNWHYWNPMNEKEIKITRDELA